MDATRSLCERHRYPAEMIAHSVWLYYRFTSSLRDVEEFVLARGIVRFARDDSHMVRHDRARIRAWPVPTRSPTQRQMVSRRGVRQNRRITARPAAGGRSGRELTRHPCPVTTYRGAAKRIFGKLMRKTGPGAEGAGNRQASQLRCDATGGDPIGRTPAVEVPQQPGREVLPLTGCSATVPKGVQCDLAALSARPTQAHRERLPPEMTGRFATWNVVTGIPTAT